MTTTTPQWARDAAEEWFRRPYADANTKDVLAQIIASHALGWVSVEDRLPEELGETHLQQTSRDSDRVLIRSYGWTITGYYSHKYELWWSPFIKNIPAVTHWMYIPKTPQEVE